MKEEIKAETKASEPTVMAEVDTYKGEIEYITGLDFFLNIDHEVVSPTYILTLVTPNPNLNHTTDLP